MLKIGTKKETGKDMMFSSIEENGQLWLKEYALPQKRWLYFSEIGTMLNGCERTGGTHSFSTYFPNSKTEDVMDNIEDCNENSQRFQKLLLKQNEITFIERGNPNSLNTIKGDRVTPYYHLTGDEKNQIANFKNNNKEKQFLVKIGDWFLTTTKKKGTETVLFGI